MRRHAQGPVSLVGMALAALTAVSTVGCGENSVEPQLGRSQTGNGAPSGAHYNLNLIGVPRDKTATMDNNNGHRIFVPLWGNAKIYLSEGDFAVLDANGTDGDGAAFSLPNPDPNNDGVTEYSVFVRALGKPNGQATLQSCYTDSTGEWCAVHFLGGVEPITVGRTHGKQTFTNVSKDLLFVDVCIEWDAITGACTTVRQLSLFEDPNLGYLWDYDNQGLKLAQLRFYEGVQTVTPWGS